MHTSLDALLAPSTRRASLLVTLAVSALALFWHLGDRGLNEPDEGRYASVAYEMVRSGDWLVPRFQGNVHLSKPPLTYWLTALSFKAFGVNEWAARLVPALAALGTVLLTWSLAFRWWGPRGALHAALVLLAGPLFFAVARVADPNLLLTFFVTLGAWAYVRWNADGRARHRLLFYAVLGLAALTKGPVGPVLVLLLAASAWFDAKAETRRGLLWWPGIALATALGASWHAWLIWRQPRLLDYFLYDELYARVFTNLHEQDQPLVYFLVLLPLAALPWLPVLVSLVRRHRTSLRDEQPDRLLATWLALMLALFTASVSKLATYLVPACPALALLIAAQLRREPDPPSRARLAFLVALAAVLPLALLSLAAGRYAPGGLLTREGIVGLACIAALAVLLVRRRALAWVPPAALLLLAAYGAGLAVVSAREDLVDEARTARPLAQALRRELTAQRGPVIFIKAPAGLEFYLRSPVPPNRLPLQQADEEISPRRFARRLAAQVRRLQDTDALLVGGEHLGGLVPELADGEVARVVYRNRKYAVWRVLPAPERGADATSG